MDKKKKKSMSKFPLKEEVVCVCEWVCVHHVSMKISIVFVCAVPLTCVCQAESPESEVGGCVGDAAQAVLDGVDGLMHEHISDIKLLQIAQQQKNKRSSSDRIKTGKLI